MKKSYIRQTIQFFVQLLTETPFYPHWLENIKRKKGDDHILMGLRGNILEVGAGDGSKKQELMSKYKNIKRYTSTDYTSWDNLFKKENIKLGMFWGLASDFFRMKQRIPLDNQCSALKLPYRNNTFDYHLSFEVLEHIDDPFKYIKEAKRVIKKGGFIAFCVPFLYRVHGGEPDHKMDYFRYAHGFFWNVAKINQLKAEVYSNTGFGTTWCSLTNQWVIQCILRSSIFIKIPLLIIAPFIFLVTNISGYIIDMRPDIRFSTRFHVRMQKK